MKLGSNLTKICKEQGFTITYVAKTSGIPLQTIHGWITGRKSVNPLQIKKVASVLKVPIYKLLFDEPDPYEVIGNDVLKEIFTGDIRVTLHKIESKCNL